MAIIFRKHPFNCPFLFWFIFSTLALLFLPGYNSLASTQISLEWMPNSESDLAGYKVFCREEDQSYDYANPSWEGTDNYCTIFDLDETKNYCFAVRAYDTEGLESSNSNEVCREPTIEPHGKITIEAEDMPIKTTGGSTTDGWNIWANGYIADDVDFPTEGTYTFEVRSKGDFVGGAWPIMEVRIDQTAVGTFTVDSSSWIVYTIDAYVTSGTHEVAIAFTNDYYNPPEDRNLLIDKMIITEFGDNEPPVANAGPDQTVDEGVVVALDGTSSIDIDDGITSYQWTQIGVPTVTLSNPASSQPTFTAPDVGPDGVSLTFNLTVTDTGGLQTTDSCIVNISWQNEPPTAVVAPNYMEPIEETLVTLDGAASMDPDDGIASHFWSQVDGDPVSIADPTSAVTTFTAPKSDQHGKNLKFRLTVKDFGGLQGTADSSIYVRQNDLPNNPPASDYSFAVKRKVASFTDNSSDTDGTIASWFWNFGDGKTSTERNPNHRYVKFGNYSVTLTVTDDGGTSNYTSKTVSITK
jgi:PKD repeat protein